MTPETTTTEPPDHMDPWGFGVTAADQSVRIEWCEPLDEPADDLDPAELAALVGLPADVQNRRVTAPLGTGPAADGLRASLMSAPLPSPPVPQTPPSRVPVATAGEGALVRLPFPPDRLGVMALFGAVIVAQAFYIGFSLTGEASARPAGVVPRPPTVAVTPVAHVDRPSVVTDVPRPSVGQLRIDTGAVPAAVQMDGAMAGTTPVVIPAVEPGPHAVRLVFAGGAVVERTVDVDAGAVVSLLVDAPAPTRPVASPVTAAGWVRVDAPFDVQVFAAGQLVGAGSTERIMLPPGAHEIELVNAALGYRTTVRATVVAGKLVPLAVDTPRVPVAVNALPWAEVIVDGRVRGETPMADLLLPVGVHQIVLRHPDLGERTETVTVRATGDTRVAADLRR